MAKRKNRKPKRKPAISTDRKPKEVTRRKVFKFEYDGKEYGLTPLQKAFAEIYLETYNGGKAAKLAGYKGNKNNLRGIASENLTKLNITQYMNYLLRDLGLNDYSVDRELLYLLQQKQSMQGKKDAIKIYNEMQGRNAPQKHEHTIEVVEVIDYSKAIEAEVVED